MLQMFCARFHSLYSSGTALRSRCAVHPTLRTRLTRMHYDQRAERERLEIKSTFNTARWSIGCVLPVLLSRLHNLYVSNLYITMYPVLLGAIHFVERQLSCSRCKQ